MEAELGRRPSSSDQSQGPRAGLAQEQGPGPRVTGHQNAPRPWPLGSLGDTGCPSPPCSWLPGLCSSRRHPRRDKTTRESGLQARTWLRPEAAGCPAQERPQGSPGPALHPHAGWLQGLRDRKQGTHGPGTSAQDASQC